MRRSPLAPLTLLLSLLVAAGCSSDEPAPDPGSGAVVDPLSDDYDECAEFGWYDDGECDEWCAQPDPDCAEPGCEDACVDACEAEWSGTEAPEMPAGCSADACRCGEPPIECPDICLAECTGQPVGEVPTDCPVYACDCDQVLGTGMDPEGPIDVRARGESCGTAPPSAARIASVESDDIRDALREVTASAARANTTFRVVWHVLRGPGDDGHLRRATLIRQINIMNRAFRHTPFRFRLHRITRQENWPWHYMKKDSAEERQAKRSLHVGGPSMLNVYSGRLRVNGPSGWATFPWDREGKMDGIVIMYGCLPGGDLAPINLGDNMVHEAGHWLGLLHTFEGGCAGSGDGVGDTAAEREPASACVRRDSCPDRRGQDSVNNYMNYTGDSCRNYFSPGQRRRLGRLTRRFRVGSGSGAPIAGCGDGTCDGSETDESCPADCGCAAVSCDGLAPFGCYCDSDCGTQGDCCSDADTCH